MGRNGTTARPPGIHDLKVFFPLFLLYFWAYINNLYWEKYPRSELFLKERTYKSIEILRQRCVPVYGVQANVDLRSVE
jgi:hypothetical protein